MPILPSPPDKQDNCSQCITFLKSALNTPRPRQILAAMSAKTHIQSPNGSTITITSTPPSSSSHTTPSSSSPSPLLPRQPLATSHSPPLIPPPLPSSHPLDTPPSSSSPSPPSSYPDITIRCDTCSSEGVEGGARAFVRGPDPVSIVLCANRLSGREEVEEVLVHELIHAYDVRVRNMDLRNCQQLAHSEVRAAREAECRNSLSRFTKSLCTKQKATVATRNMFPERGRDCVCDVFESAMRDMAPFFGRGDGGSGVGGGGGGGWGETRDSER